MKKRAILSLSGGMDSACLLACLLASKKFDAVHAYNFDYGQRHSIELEKAKELVEFLNSKLPEAELSYQLINLRDVFSDSQSALGGDLTQAEVPKDEYKLETSKVTVVENRNVIFSSIVYSKALAISKKYDCNTVIALGVHAGDHAVYPDCTPQSVSAARRLFKISNWGSERVSYRAPFVHLTKDKLLQRGIRALKKLKFSDADVMEFFARTNTCYDPQNGKACGACSSCRERLVAFKMVNIKDPVAYINEENQ